MRSRAWFGGLAVILAAGIGHSGSLTLGQSTPHVHGGTGVVPPAVSVLFAPDPDQVVNLLHYFGTTPPYVVPAGKDLVLTDWSINAAASGIRVYVNGNVAWHANMPGQWSSWVSAHGSWEAGLVAHAGDSVELRADLGPFMILPAYGAGFLVDQPSFGPTVRIPFIPDSADLVRIDSYAAYTVPSNHKLIIRDWSTGDAGSSYSDRLRVSINGIVVWEVSDSNRSSGSIRSGVLAVGGDSVTVTPTNGSGNPEAFLIGFLRRL